MLSSSLISRSSFPRLIVRTFHFPMCIMFFFFLESEALFCLRSFVTRSSANLPLGGFGMIPSLAPLVVAACEASPVAIRQDLPPGVSGIPDITVSSWLCCIEFLANHIRRVAITIRLPITNRNESVGYPHIV